MFQIPNLYKGQIPKYYMEAKIKCRFCKSEDYSKEGFRKTKLRGKIQKFKCLYDANKTNNLWK